MPLSLIKEPLAEGINRATWPPRVKPLPPCLPLPSPGGNISYSISSSALFDFYSHLCNLPHPKGVPERPLGSKIGINHCFQRASYAFDRMNCTSAGCGSCGLYSKCSQFIGSGDIPLDVVLLWADAVVLGLLGDGNFTMVLPGYSVRGRGCGWEKQPSSDNAAAALTKNRIPCLI